MNPLLIALIILGVMVLWFVLAYNSFVRSVNRAKEAWADIDVQLKRRYDLIPNLVEAVKGYAAHEKNVFEQVTEARTRALNAESKGDVGGVEKAESALSGALKTLFAVSENYPVLRASENFKELQLELADTENKIQAARRFYNANVRDLNTRIETFPYSIVAKSFNFQKREFFELASESEKEPVKIKI